MGRHYRRTAASFVTAAAVLAVVFAAFFAVDDVLPIPQQFREILGLASADTTGVGDLAETAQLDGGRSGLESQPSTSSAESTDSVSTSDTLTTSPPSEETSPTLSPQTTSPGEGPQGAQTQEFDVAESDGPSREESDPTPPPLARTAARTLSQPSMASGALMADTSPPEFPEGALLRFRYPMTNGFTVGYTRAQDDESTINYYGILIEEVDALGSATVLSSVEASTAADSFTATGLDAGAYRVSVTAVDDAANESVPLVGEVLVGHARPSVMVSFIDTRVAEAILVGGWINWGGPVEVAVAVDTPAPSYQIRSVGLGGLTSVTNAIASEPATTTIVALEGEGEATVSISAIDCYSLESTATTFVLRVDRVAPTSASMVRATQLRGTTALRVAWAGGYDLTSGVSHYNVSVTDVRTGAVRAVRKGPLVGATHTFTDLEPGQYRVDVVTVDAAGNKSAPASVTYTVTKPTSASAGSAGGLGGGSGVSQDQLEPAPTVDGPAADEPSEKPGRPALPIDTKIDDSNRLYWLIGAAGFGIGLLMIYFTAVYRAFNTKDN